jgi:hypothetical protein
MRIIGLVGAYKSGKDTVGQYIVDNYNGTRYAFADKLKKVCSDVFGIPLENFYNQDLKDTFTTIPCVQCALCKSFNANVIKEIAMCWRCHLTAPVATWSSFWTYRNILQYIGTEGFRTVSPLTWVNFVERAIIAASVQDADAVAVITDVRFREEAEMVWKHGGEIWRIKRPGFGADIAHQSEQGETAIPDAEVQAIILNDGTLDQLKIRARAEFLRCSGTR